MKGQYRQSWFVFEGSILHPRGQQQDTRKKQLPDLLSQHRNNMWEWYQVQLLMLTYEKLSNNQSHVLTHSMLREVVFLLNRHILHNKIYNTWYNNLLTLSCLIKTGSLLSPLWQVHELFHMQLCNQAYSVFSYNNKHPQVVRLVGYYILINYISIMYPLVVCLSPFWQLLIVEKGRGWFTVPDARLCKV